ncbi:cytochrome P450 [Streptomyces sp. WMMB303]|uniref:cytochrome P450 n=1 Tax=Streptomyces sp. WMMB303 TaxID=3034154 RepID=UPI0023EC837A|nr:cytochrome P450 [Streptomyces sp. WMMB303]MDF4251921.1 cytochrome P450 [Streptomyces sp. WMMB303]
MPHPPGAMPAPLTDPDSSLTPLHGESFARDPYTVYDRLRGYGALAPVELAPGVSALLVTDYRAALSLLHDSRTWAKDPRPWQETALGASQVRPMLEWRASVLFNDGDTHRRYRGAVVDSLERIEPHVLRDHVCQVADDLVARFGARGEADLIGEYARVLPLLVFNRMFGLSDASSGRLVRGLASMMEGRTPEEAAAGKAEFDAYVAELIAEKKRQRGEDITSCFLHHPANLDDDEVREQLVMCLGAGNEPTGNLIGSSLARMLSDSRYYSTLTAGSLTPRDAIHDVLQNEPPMSNFSPHYARHGVLFHGTWVPEGQLVLVSYAAANTQHGRTAIGEQGQLDHSVGGAHLAWGAGVHACPAQRPALLIATTAIERLTAWLADLELTVAPGDLTWRHGPFHRALTRLPVRFTPTALDSTGATTWMTTSS